MIAIGVEVNGQFHGTLLEDGSDCLGLRLREGRSTRIFDGALLLRSGYCSKMGIKVPVDIDPLHVEGGAPRRSRPHILSYLLADSHRGCRTLLYAIDVYKGKQDEDSLLKNVGNLRVCLRQRDNL